MLRSASPCLVVCRVLLGRRMRMILWHRDYERVECTSRVFPQAIQFGEVEAIPLSDPAGEKIENLVQVLDTAHCLNCVEIPFRCSFCYRGLGKFKGNVSDELLILIFRFDDPKAN